MQPLIPALLLLAAPALATPRLTQEPPLRVFLHGGPKTHGEGEHDHPRFVEEWSRLLTERGCAVQGALEFPSAAALEASDVLVIFAADGASIHGDERARLEAFLARGGGLVVLHDGVCGDDPLWFQTVAGGAWEDGRSKYYEGEIGLVFADREHPITKGVANFDFEDEIYWDLHLDPEAHVLANSFQTPFDVTPQMWTLERDGHRAFVSIQGHLAKSFANPAWRTLLLRGIAWAGKRDADALVSAAEVAALRYPAGGPHAPERAAETIELHPDFALSLVAAEPLVVNPISLDWDARGRMWVALTPGYPDKQEFSGVAARDQVVILSDADGDGRMDGRTVFADGLDLVTSLVFHRDGVIVAQSPEILWLRDKDGDDRADERAVLFKGFGYHDTHAVVSNLRWGLDGWIYATQGYSGNDSRHVIGRDGKDKGAIGNGLFRFRPDGSAIEMVSAYSANTWGLDFSWDGELFFGMANGSHLRHVVAPERELAAGRVRGLESWLDISDHERVFPLRSHERAPYQQIDFVGAFTAGCGTCVYTGGAWPSEWDGAVFTCEPTVNLVHHDALAPKGVTFAATKAREREFLASTDLWFRPVHERVGPDGALYVLDFYNQAAVHNDTRGPAHGPTNAAVRPDRDHEHGRIWRIQHRAAKPAPVPALAGAKEAELVAALAHPNGWVRDTARRLLAERERLESATTTLLATRALGTYAAVGRVNALWLLAARAPDVLTDAAAGLLRDPVPGVRRAALLALATLDDWRRARALQHPLELFLEPDERVRLAGLELLRLTLPEAGLARLVQELPGLGDDWSRSAALAIAAHRPAAFVAATLAAPASPELVRILRELGATLARRGDLGAAVEVVTVLGEHTVKEPEGGAALLEELARGLDPAAKPWPSPRLESAWIGLLASEHVELGMAALPLCARWSAGGQVSGARVKFGARMTRLANDAAEPLERRLTALAAALAQPDEQRVAVSIAGTLLDPLVPLEAQERVIELLGALPEGAATLCARFGALSRPARERALAALLARPASSGVLLDALASGDVRANELGPQGLHRLRNHPDAATAARATEVLAKLVGAEQSDKDALVAQLAPLVEAPGDAARGRELFAQNCGNCHTAAGVETRGGVGPDLTGMGAHGARELLPFLLDPNRAVEPGFLEYVVETTDGELVDGVIARETSEALLLRNSAGEREIPRTRIRELRTTGRSPMPTGFESLGADALRDILAFLAGDWRGWRVLDLRPFVTSSTSRGLYDTRRDAKPMRFRKLGVVGVEGVPFEILDPARMGEERNALTLRGGLAEGWESHGYPQQVEIPIGAPVFALEVLGGIAAWGYPYTDSRSPAVKLTWNYADGAREERVLTDGTEFADWIGRNDVAGSKWVDLLAPDSWGQVRTFRVAPARVGASVRSLELASYDNHLAPTFLALTVRVEPEAAGAVSASVEPSAPSEVLVFGGGSSHDFERWFHAADVETLRAAGERAGYCDSPAELARLLASARVLVLCNNQPLADPALRTALFQFVERGGGLVLVHAATWYNWADWPEFNRELVGGGARGHEEYAEFGVRLSGENELTRGAPRSFSVKDELYRVEPDPSSPSEVLAVGRSLATGAEFPVLWTRAHGQGRIVALTLGHDGGAHEHAAYRALLTNAVRWAGRR